MTKITDPVPEGPISRIARRMRERRYSHPMDLIVCHPKAAQELEAMGVDPARILRVEKIEV